MAKRIGRFTGIAPWVHNAEVARQKRVARAFRLLSAGMVSVRGALRMLSDAFARFGEPSR